MPKGPIQPAVLDALQARALHRAALRQPPPANVEAATTAHDEGLVEYRGRVYRLRPVDYRTGLRLQVLDFELKQLHLHQPTPEVAAQALLVLDAMIALLDALVIRPWWHRLLRRRWSLFHDAEEGELRALAGFFSPARMRFPVSVRGSVRAPAWVQPTWQTGSPSSRVGIRAGWRRTAIPAALAIYR
jgi:hypothetical protein